MYTGNGPLPHPASDAYPSMPPQAETGANPGHSSEPVQLTRRTVLKLGGKDESRAIRTIAEIEANKASIRGVFSKVLKYGNGPSDAIMLDNAEWLTRLNWIEMLRDVGRHFSVNRMLTSM